MDQKTIVDALQKALTKGSGTLDDLDNLLKRAQADIAQAKREEKEAREKAEAARCKMVVDLANRLLQGKITDDDCAYVINAWMKTHGYDGAGLTGKELADIFLNVDAADQKVSKDLDNAINELADSLVDWAKALGIDITKSEKNKTAAKPASTPKSTKNIDADDVIDDFLKKFGLR